MRYEKTEEKNALVKSYQDHKYRQEIELFCETLTQYIKYLLINLESVMLYKEKINLDFNTIIQWINKTVTSDERFEKIIERDLQGNWKIYKNWSPLDGVHGYLSRIQEFHQQSSLYTLDGIIASLVEDYNAYMEDYEEIMENSEQQLTPIFHELTEMHVKDVVKRLQEAKHLAVYADLSSIDKLDEMYAELMQDSTLFMQNKLRRLDLDQEKSPENANELIKSIIASAKEVFNYDNSPKFYTFCMRIFDSIITSSDVLKCFSAHCAHPDYNIKENDSQLAESVLALSNLVAENNSNSRTINYAVGLLRGRRKELIERMYSDMPPPESFKKPTYYNSSFQNQIAFRSAWIEKCEKEEDDREVPFFEKNELIEKTDTMEHLKKHDPVLTELNSEKEIPLFESSHSDKQSEKIFLKRPRECDDFPGRGMTNNTKIK